MCALQPSATATTQVLTLGTPGTYWFTSQQGADCANGGSGDPSLTSRVPELLLPHTLLLLPLLCLICLLSLRQHAFCCSTQFAKCPANVAAGQIIKVTVPAGTCGTSGTSATSTTPGGEQRTSTGPGSQASDYFQCNCLW